MRKQILALMDSEETYARHFMEHVNRKKTTPFEVHAFSDKAKLKAYAEEHQIEILLISEHDLEEETPLPAGQVVVLTDGVDSGGLYPNVCKYQASSAVMREVMTVYGSRTEADAPSGGAVLKPPTKIIGVFSPISRCLKTSFSLALGQRLAAMKATLYLNFEASGGLQTLLGEHWARDISEVIYYIRRGDRNLTARMLPLIRELGPMGFVPPSPSPSEIYDVSAKEWHQLFISLRRDSAYEALVLDLGMLPLLIPELLEECDVIYMPVLDDEISRAKTEAFTEELRLRDSETAGKLRPLRLELRGQIPLKGHWAEQLALGPLGRIAEEQIRKEGL